MSEKELEKLILSLAKEGKREPDIGRILRDSHGVPSAKQVSGKTISHILKDANASFEYPADLIQLIRRAVRLRKHLKANTQDNLNATALTRTESKIRRLVRHYRGKKLPADWKYDPEKAALLVK